MDHDENLENKLTIKVYILKNIPKTITKILKAVFMLDKRSRRWLTTLALLCGTTLSAQPNQPHVVAGEAVFSDLVTKNGPIKGNDRTIIEWNSFSIAADEILRISLPSTKSALLNRVTGKEISQLLGRLESNGKVYLINPSGIVIGKEGVIKTTGFLASTLDLSNEEFLHSTSWTLKGEGSDIVNLGTVETTYGDLILIAKNIRNEGHITSTGGSTHLAAETTVLLKFKETPLLSIELSEEAKNTIVNTGHIEAIQTNPYTFAVVSENGTIKLEKSEGRLLIVAANLDNSGNLKASNDIQLKTERVINTGSLETKENLQITENKMYNAAPMTTQDIKVNLSGPYM